MIVTGQLSALFDEVELQNINLKSLIGCPILVDYKPVGVVMEYSIDKDEFKATVFSKNVHKEYAASNLKNIFSFYIE